MNARALRRAAELRQQWAAYHRRRDALFKDLAERHRAELGRLIDGAAQGT